MDYVVDASVFLPLLLRYGRSLRGVLARNRFHVLDLTCYETCNGLWKESVKLRILDTGTATRLCRCFIEIAARYTRIHSICELDAARVMEIAVSCGITFYDAAYIELARMHGIPVASNDRDILVNAPRYGVEVYSLAEFEKLLGLG